MFDFIKAAIKKTSLDQLNDDGDLKFILMVDEETGEVKKKTAIFQSLRFIINNNRHLNIHGSFHKYRNNGKHNYDDFSLGDYLEILKSLSARFKFDPSQTLIHNLEFGVNISMPFRAEKFLKSIIAYKGQEYCKETFNNKGYLLRFVFDHYDFKIYNKSKQYGLENSIVRFEIKVKKMEYFNSNARAIGIYTYLDLLKQDVNIKLKTLLLEAVGNLMFYDWSIDIEKANRKNDRKLLRNGRNPKYWNDLPRNKLYYRRLKKFKELNVQFGKHHLPDLVRSLINEKLVKVATIDCKLEKTIACYVQSFQNKNVPILTDFWKKNVPVLTINSDKMCTRFNHLTSRDLRFNLPYF